ncbi:MAG: ParB/RepB/Spo0J family partition protein [Candidatus Hydrogenedentes bacterium]|nr:ParB/RepB/Spo0J family partition protein [Candidatus Hydrogenedentota bacterium]
MASMKRKGLGKGLGALLGGGTGGGGEGMITPSGNDGGGEFREPHHEPAAPVDAVLSDGTRLIELDPSEIQPNPKQPRHVFDEAALEELSESIRRDGIQQPVVVRQRNGKYELIAGERRVRAAIMADLKVVPAVCRDVPDEDMLKYGLIENLQRENLNAIETAMAYQELIEQFHWTQDQLSQEVGKKRATVANTLRLLNLPDMVQEMVADGSLSMGHARAILALDSPERQAAMARRTIKEDLTVRQVEKLAAQTKPERSGKSSPARDPNIMQIEDALRRRLGTKVSLKVHSPDKGRIEIDYYSLEELERLLSIFRANG